MPLGVPLELSVALGLGVAAALEDALDERDPLLDGVPLALADRVADAVLVKLRVPLWLPL